MVHAIISDGRLYVCNEQGVTEEIESTFVKEKQERSERQQAYHSWKSQANANDGIFNPQAVWGNLASSGLTMSYRFKDVVVADDRTLYYILTNGVITGLFKYDLAEGFEARLFHRNDLIECGFDFSPSRQEFIIAVQYEDMRCNLALFGKTGSLISSLTGGDSRDSYPSYSRKKPDRIFFQSAGISRDEAGYPLLFGPETIYCQDLDAEEIQEVLAYENYDLLLPKEDNQGNLYFIRRPYQTPGHTSFGRAFIDTILFPFRFLIAVVGFLNAFTKLFNQQSFKANGPNIQPLRQDKHVRILGQTIQMAKIQRHAKFKKEPSLVPGTWELMRRDTNGNLDVLARNVSSYDIDSAGNLSITNGYRVSSIACSETKMLFRYNAVEILKSARN